jgi:DNA-binding MarR family transcriptional regulator
VSHKKTASTTDERIRILAEFRYTLRRFLHFSEDAATRAGLTPQQHQLLLQIAGAPHDAVITIGYLAERLALRHHSTVELCSRCESAGLIVRGHGEQDGRLVVLKLTAAGSRVLHALSEDHACELNELAPKLIEALTAFSSIKPSTVKVRKDK